jgi:hypothetical protein
MDWTHLPQDKFRFERGTEDLASRKDQKFLSQLRYYKVLRILPHGIKQPSENYMTKDPLRHPKFVMTGLFFQET